MAKMTITFEVNKAWFIPHIATIVNAFNCEDPQCVEDFERDDSIEALLPIIETLGDFLPEMGESDLALWNDFRLMLGRVRQGE